MMSIVEKLQTEGKRSVPRGRQRSMAEDQAEYHTTVEQVWIDSTSAAAAGAALRASLEDAVQAGRPWASAKLDEALVLGTIELAKRFQRSQRIRTKRGRVAGAAGVTVVVDGQPSWEQIPLARLTPEQVRQAVQIREAQRDASTRNLWVLRTVGKLCARHPAAATVADALAAEDLTLDELLERAA